MPDQNDGTKSFGTSPHTVVLSGQKDEEEEE